ncbi:hypothetical protein ABEB36_012247 [Hypothenemus hampei]|uniref:Spaetzle domain-containing protein n=1 Tax=Hypothenemus hampei TaxID=57062 RepID=A0ABD1EBC3_HYPHA
MAEKCFYILNTMIAYILAQYIRDSNGNYKVLAANRGQVPPCVTEPSQTFCEEVPNYPYELVWIALKNAPFDVSKFLVDETPNSSDLGPLTFKEISKLTQDNYSAKTQKHSTTSNNKELHQFDEDELFYFNHYPVNIDGIQRKKKHVVFSKDDLYGLNRTKRATRLNPGSPLCRSRYVYAFPQVGMCTSTGDWMYIVNAQKTAFTQMVRLEYCHKPETSCMGDCSSKTLPLGLESRCEQQYLQRRLLTLSDSGSEVFTMMFWLPSGCVCKTYRLEDLDES